MYLRKNRSGIFYLTACLLLSTLGGLMLLGPAGFFLGITLSPLHLPLAFVLASGLTFLLARREGEARASFLAALLVSIVAFVLATVVAGYFIDTSWDGQFYHQESVYQLKNGWNPQRHHFPYAQNTSIWINHYPQGAELPQAAIYSLTDRIETGKATNLLLAFASFLLTACAFRRLSSFPPWKILLYSFFLAASPIVVNQAFTYYIDGQLSSVILSLLALCLLLCRAYRPSYLVLLAFSILLLVNLKFTGLVFAALMVGAFLFYLLMTRRKAVFRRMGLVAIAAGVVAAGLSGYHPYVTNALNNGHPMHPVLGSSKIDVMDELLPTGFGPMGRYQRLFHSIFSHTDDPGPWLAEKRKTELKWPFAINGHDLSYSRIENARVGGFGPFFSGILVLSALALVLALIRGKKTACNYHFLFLSAGLLLLVLLFPQSWWARFVPYFWFLPLSLMVGAELWGGGRFLSILKPVLYAAVLINIAFSLISIPFRVLRTEQVKYQMAQLRSFDQPIRVQFLEARSNAVRFQEHGLPFTEASIDSSRVGYIIGSNTRFELPGELPALPRNFVLRWLER